MPNERRVLSSIALAAMLTFGGCVTPELLSGRVSTAAYTAPATGSSFVVVGADAASLSLVEKEVQRLLTGQMIALGFKRAENRESADLAVLYSYEIGAGTTKVSSSPDFVFGGHRVESRTSYPRVFQIAVVDLKASRPANDVKVVWQGELYSSGPIQDMGTLARHFIEEIFKHFGKSETNRHFAKVI